MLNKVHFKNEYLLVTATIILLVISYQLSFKKTIESWRIHKQLTAQLAQVSDLSYQPGYLERKNHNLSKIIDRFKGDSLAFRSNNINTIAAIAEKGNVKVSEVPIQDPLFHTDKLIIQKINFEGDFFALTKVLDQLQTANNIGFVRSATYKITKINSNVEDAKKLVLEIYLELVK